MSSPPSARGRVDVIPPLDHATRSSSNPAGTAVPLLLASGLFLLLAVAALTVDLRLAAWCKSQQFPSDLKKFFGLTEVFGHGLGVGLILVAIWQLDRQRLWALPRVMATAYGAGLLADLAKLLLGRTRPEFADLHGRVLDTFVGWLPMLSGGSRQQSFPSAHTATAVGLALALAWLYPRGRWLFLGLAVCVACQRISHKAHFLSDTLVGAALGSLSAALFLRAGRVATLFDRWEARWSGRPRGPQNSSSAG
jgi:membrane-associated phospholipid phosphatase